MKESFLKKILRSAQTVFSFKELLLMMNTDDTKSLKSKLYYYVRTKDLHHIRRGLYSKSTVYDRRELAVKILTPSYISFETVLSEAGVIFQYYSQIFVASYQSRSIICDEQTYVFRALRPTILVNALGVNMFKEYCIASPERAFLDIVYHHIHYHFDNLDPLDWNKIYEILPAYGNNKRMKKRVDAYYNLYKRNKLDNQKGVNHDS